MQTNEMIKKASRVLAGLLLILIGAYLILFEIAMTISEGHLLDPMPLNKKIKIYITILIVVAIGATSIFFGVKTLKRKKKIESTA